MANPSPLVTILLPVLRNDQFLTPAIDSILNQSYPNLRVLLITDSNIDFGEIVARDLRVTHLKVPSNSNLSQKLNAGIEACTSKYFARMDADDLAHPKRIETQVNFLENNTEIDLLGTGIQFIGNLTNHRHSHGQIALLPSENNQLLTYMLNKNPFFHPTVMFRTQTLKRHNLRYNVKYARSQDYELWTRAAGKLNFHNLQEPLLDYRLHDSQAGVIGEIDSEYFSNLAKLKYCLGAIFQFNPRSLIALQLIPFRVKQMYRSWRKRREKKRRM
jgi:glycosyltransferase involved in cell wall biosynthesis